jgi:hypothetical protein
MYTYLLRDIVSRTIMSPSAIRFGSVVLFACLLWGGGSTLAQNNPESLLALELDYDKAIADLNTPLRNLEDNYTKHLQQLFIVAQNSGNLEHSLEVKQELEGFREGAGPKVIHFPDLVRAREVYEEQMAKLTASRQTAQDAIMQHHISALTALQILFTKQQQLDKAIQVKKALIAVTEARAKIQVTETPVDDTWIIPITSEKHESKAPVRSDRAVSDKFHYVESNDTFGILRLTFDDPRLYTLGLEIERATLRFHTATVALSDTRDEIRVMLGQTVAGKVKGAAGGRVIDVELDPDILMRAKAPFQFSLRCGDDAVIVMSAKSSQPATLILKAK